MVGLVITLSIASNNLKGCAKMSSNLEAGYVHKSHRALKDWVDRGVALRLYKGICRIKKERGT